MSVSSDRSFSGLGQSEGQMTFVRTSFEEPVDDVEDRDSRAGEVNKCDGDNGIVRDETLNILGVIEMSVISRG